MYKIPENFDTSAIKNEVIRQVAFGLNFITLFFDKGFIQFSGSFTVNIAGDLSIYDEVYPVKNDFRLLKILEKRIINVKCNSERDQLIIIFEEGSELVLIGSKFYESFLINIEGKEFRV